MSLDPIHIRLRQYSRPIKAGRSKWWGNPDLPFGMEYPTYIGKDGEEYQYFFICQLRCEELSDFDKTGVLPAKGLLYFFGKIDFFMDYEVGDDIPDQGLWDDEGVRVIYVEDVDESNLQQIVMVDEDDEDIAPREWGIRFSDKKKRGGIGDVHQVLGDPYLLPEADWESPCEGWSLLLQVDSFDGDDFQLLFANMGLLYFIIAPEDLKAKNFDRVRATLISM